MAPVGREIGTGPPPPAPSCAPGGSVALAHSEKCQISPPVISTHDIVTRMTPEQALHQVEKIRASAGDDEVAHGLEDDLYQAFVASIANTSPDQILGDLVETASIILTTGDVPFSRWCA